MSDQPEQPCQATVERIGDLVVLDVPDGKGHHYEIAMSCTYALRLASAIVRVATDGEVDSLADTQIAKLIETQEGTP